MRIVTNKKLAKRNRQFATYLFFITFAVLIGGFFLVNITLFDPEATPTALTLLLQMAVLPVALIFTLISIRMTNLWVRVPRPDKALEDGLKGLSNKSVLYNYHHIPARHILICPQGVFVITTRWHDGSFSVEGDRWRVNKSALGRMLNALRFDGIGNPTRDAKRAAEHAEKLLNPIAPDVNVQPVIVFVDPRVELDITDPDVPVLYADPKSEPNLTSYLRDVKREIAEENGQKNKATMPLSKKQISEFEEKTI